MMRSKYLLAALLAFAPLASHAVQTTYTFDTVTGIEHSNAVAVTLTGVLVDETLPTTVAIPIFNTGSGGLFDRCEHLFNVVLSQPSLYNLTVVLDINPPAPGFPAVLFLGCKATAKP